MIELTPTRATAPTADPRVADAPAADRRAADPRRSGPPFGDVLAAADQRSQARPRAALSEGRAPVVREGEPDATDPGLATSESGIAGLAVARAAIEQPRPRSAGNEQAERVLPPGLTVARAAVEAAGAQGTPGGPVFAAHAAAPLRDSEPIESPSAGPIEAAVTATGDPEPPVLAATPDAVGSETVAALEPQRSPASTDVVPTPAAPLPPPQVPSARTVDTSPEVVETTTESVDARPAGADVSATSAPPAPVNHEPPTTMDTATEALAPTATAPTVAPSSPGSPTPTPATAFVGRLVDAATRLENAPAPREVVLDLRDILGGDTSISVRLVRGEVHVSIRGELPPGEWQRELADSLSQRGFGLGSFDRRDRSSGQHASAGGPGERDRSDHPAPVRGRRPVPPHRPDHADVRHAAGLRL